MLVLATYRSQVEARGWRDERLSALLLEAIASRAAGSLQDARRLMDEAMDAALPHGHVRSFVDNGAPMARLLREVAGRHHAQALRLLGAFPTAGRAARTAPAGLVEPLSGRELEVLGILAEGLSNQQIAERLFLSPLTVKVHLRNIYAKLGAGSRTQAIAIGRGLGILEGTS